MPLHTKVLGFFMGSYWFK